MNLFITTFTRGVRRYALGCVALLALMGCAAQNAYRDGRSLLAQGKSREGLAKIEEAVRLEPGSIEYRATLVQARERLTNAWIEQADRARAGGKYDAAETLYRQVEQVAPGDERAAGGLRVLDNQRRWDKLVKDAEVQFAGRDIEGARGKLRTVLAEQPEHRNARKLMAAIEDATRPPASESVLAAAYRKPITIEFRDVPLRTIFEVISRSSGLNFLFDKDVRTDQKATIYLKNSTIESAVNMVLLTNQLEQRVLDANTVLVYPNTQAKQKDYQPLSVKSFYLVNAEAKNVAATLKTLLKVRDVVVDDKLNLIIVRDAPDALRLAEKIVAMHDVPEPEVMLEVEILEIKRTRLLELGVRWPDQLTVTPLPSSVGGTLTVADLRNLNQNTLGVGVAPATINARKQDSDAKLLANPRIRTRNHEKARILIGERVPNITATSTSTGFVAESVNYVDVGLKLDVEPTIYLDDEVAIKVTLEVSNIVNQIQTKSGSLAYQIGTRNAQTVLRLRDGENQVLAGLINDEDRRTANKLPLLGEIPLLGRLFGSQADDTVKTEIVLSITPRLIRNIRRPDASALEFESGTENSLGMRGIGGGGAAAPTVPVVSSAVVRAATNIGGPSSQPTAAMTGFGNSTSNGSSASGLNAGGASGFGTSSSGFGGTNGGGNNVSNVGGVSGTSSVVDASGAANGLNGIANNTTGDSAAPTNALLRWQGPMRVKVGDTFAVQLVMQSEQPIVSLPMAIGFDPKLLLVTSVVEGDFLKQGGAQTSFTNRIDPNGQVLVTDTRAGDVGATAAGSVMTVTFRALAASNDARVQLLTVAPMGSGGRSVPALLPEPHAIVIAP